MYEPPQAQQPSQRPVFTPGRGFAPPTRPQPVYTPPAYVPRHAPLPPRKLRHFNPPPNWPAPPPGWTPPPGWQPNPSWPAPPEGWQLWTDDLDATSANPGTVEEAASPDLDGTGDSPASPSQPVSPSQPGPAPQSAWVIQDWFREGRYRNPKVLAIGGAAVFTLVAVIVGLVAASSGPAGGNSAAPVCYYSVQDTLGGNPFTVAIIGVSNCTNYAVGNSEFFVQGVNVPKGAGNAICTGQDGGQVGTVITTPDNYAAGEAYCESAGWIDLPNGN